MGLRLFHRMNDDLDHALAIPEVDEQHATVVALMRHPSAQRDLLAGVLRPELPAAVRPQLFSQDPTSLCFTVS